MPNQYAEAVRELVQAKVAQRQPDIVVEPEIGKAPPVVNIMQARKQSMQARGREKVRNAVRRRMGNGSAPKSASKTSRKRPTRSRPNAHCEVVAVLMSV
jgi:non-homologous end joining protein Ku